MTDQAKKRPRQVAAYQSLRLVTVDEAATCGAQIGVNLLLPDGTVGTIATLAKLFGSTGTVTGDSTISTTDDLEEGQWHYWFTDRRAQDAAGSILANSATVDLAYVAGTSITATLKDLADSGTGAALVKITRDSKGRISGTSAATTTDLTEGTNLYFTDERAQDAAGAALDGTGNVPLTYDDTGNKISAALSAGVLASLALAGSATQPGDLATVATTGAYADLSGLPTLGTAAATAATDYATAAQGTKADSALQDAPSDGTTYGRKNGAWSAAGGGGSGDVVGPASATDGAVAVFDGATGKLLKDGVVLGTAATTAATDYATAAQGVKADNAEPSITAGTTAQYWRGDKSWQDFATDVRAAILTGLSTASSAVIATTDTVLGALGKLQAQISTKMSDTSVAARADSSATQAIANATFQKVLLASEVFDSGSFYDPATSKFTPNKAGKYAVIATVSFAGSGPSGNRVIAASAKNGTVGDNTTASTQTFATNTVQNVTIYDMNGTTDYLELYARYDSSITLSITGTSNTNMVVYRIGA